MKQLNTTLVFLLRGNEVLLARKKHGHGQGHWNGAGGKVEASETIEQAMIREAQEEIGVTPQVYEKVAVATAYQLYKGDPVENTCHTFLCSQWTGEPSESDEMQPNWFELQQLPLATMWPDSPFWIPQILAGKKLQARFDYDDNYNLTSYEVTETQVVT